MRRPLTMLMLMASVVLPGAARADDLAAFDAVAEWPQARVLCVGAAAFPEMLRYTYQAEPEGDGRPRIIRTSNVRRASRPAPPRQNARAAAIAAVPVLRLPCILG